MVLYLVLNSKQKQFYSQKSNKMRKSTLSWIGNFEEKNDLSHICLAVPVSLSNLYTVMGNPFLKGHFE